MQWSQREQSLEMDRRSEMPISSEHEVQGRSAHRVVASETPYHHPRTLAQNIAGLFSSDSLHGSDDGATIDPSIHG